MFCFYNIDTDYLKFLHSIDSEVEYSDSYESATHKKIFLGIISTIDGYKYFIPLTSAKSAHQNHKMSLSSKNHLLIYEEVDATIKSRYPKKFFRTTDRADKFLMLISCLQFNKAIPVLDGLYTEYDINTEPDTEYKNMVMKEYSFCLSRKDDIMYAASNTILAIKKGIRVKHACNLKLLESEMNNFHKATT